MVLTIVTCALAALSFGLVLWQWVVARRFPLHRSMGKRSFTPGITLLKPLKGRDSFTEKCLRSWLTQEYSGPIQVLFGVASKKDPVAEVVGELMRQYPSVDMQLIHCGESLGPNAKVSTLAQLEAHIRHEIVVISDADVCVEPRLLGNLVSPMRDPEVGLVNCLYQLANPASLPMRWEAFACNADFWTQVLQFRSLKPLDFALGAVMATRRSCLQKLGGFRVLLDYLADDYQLGRRIAGQGERIELCPSVVECWSEPLGWKEVWNHQLRWARTIRVCQPVPFFFSVLSNGTLWPILSLFFNPKSWWIAIALGFCLVRILTALVQESRLTRAACRWWEFWMVPLKDLLGLVVWALAFGGNRIVWRGTEYQMKRNGKLEILLGNPAGHR